MKKRYKSIVRIGLLVITLFMTSCAVNENQQQLQSGDLQFESMRNDEEDSNLGEETVFGERMSKRETLDYLFDYLYVDVDYFLEVTFSETKTFWGYEFIFDINSNPSNTWFLEDEGMRKDELYQVFRLGERVYDSEGNYMHTNTSNDFAVNRETKDIIEERVFDENGVWDFNEEYIQKVWDN